MAQTGFTPLSLYYSATTTNVPLAANLVAGELAINTADGKLFYKDSGGVVQVIGTKGGVGASSTTQVLYNSGGLVVGSANMTFDGTNFATTGTATATKLIPTGTSVTGNGMYLPATNSVGISTAGTNAVYIDASQNVGIGTSSPTFRLVSANNSFDGVGLGSSSTYSFVTLGGYFSASAGAAQVGFERSTGAFVFGNGTRDTPTERMRIDSSGNVGIGTSSPATKLNVVDSGTGANTLLVQSGQTGTTVRSNTVFRVQTTAAGRDVNIQLSDNVTNSAEIGMVGGPMYFATGGIERMRIDSSGNLLVGKSALPSASVFGFAVNNSSNNFQYLMNSINTTGSGSHFQFYNPNGKVGEITTTGSTTLFTSLSDYRLKENIAPMTGALTKVLLLKPVTYKWKIDGFDAQGFIAHELQEIVPECVNGEKDATYKDGSPKYQGIDTSFLVATLTAAIQEQQTIIESLTTRLTALENK